MAEHVLELGPQVLVLVLAVQPGGGRGLVLGLEPGEDADAGGESRVEHVLRGEAEVDRSGEVALEVDEHAAERLVLGLGEPDHLRIGESRVALQVDWLVLATT